MTLALIISGLLLQGVAHRVVHWSALLAVPLIRGGRALARASVGRFSSRVGVRVECAESISDFLGSFWAVFMGPHSVYWGTLYLCTEFVGKAG